MKPIHKLLMLLTVAVWGFNFVATRVVLEVFSPQQLAFVRAAVTFLILLPWWKPHRRIPAKLVGAALAIGVVSFYLLYVAIGMTESLTTVAVGTQLMPPLSAVMALLLYRERVGPRKWFGILLATAGATYLAGVTKSPLSVTALGVTVLSVLFYSVGTVIIGKEPAVGIWRMLAWIAAAAVPPLWLAALASGPVLPDPGLLETGHWLALFYSVVFSALMGQAVLFLLYRRYPVASVAPWTLLVPLFAGLSAILAYGESIAPGLVAGGAVILLGVWIQQRQDAADPAEDDPRA